MTPWDEPDADPVADIQDALRANFDAWPPQPFTPISPTCHAHNTAANASPPSTPSKPSAQHATTTHAPKSKP